MMKWLTVDWHSEKVKVPVQKIKGKLWFHVDGETHSLEIPSGRKKDSQGGGHKNGEITAPMPGKILKVFASAGQKVTQGQPLIAMEAMKMEYTLEADIDGTLKELNVQVGDQVALGQHLAKVEEA
jgi:biotin carboxyl carrier protein